MKSFRMGVARAVHCYIRMNQKTETQMVRVKFRFLDWAYAARETLIAAGFACSPVEFSTYFAGGEFWTDADDAACLDAMRAVAEIAE